MLWDYKCFKFFFLKLCSILQMTFVQKHGLFLLERKNFIMCFQMPTATLLTPPISLFLIVPLQAMAHTLTLTSIHKSSETHFSSHLTVTLSHTPGLQCLGVPHLFSPTAQYSVPVGPFCSHPLEKPGSFLSLSCISTLHLPLDRHSFLLLILHT